MPVRTVDKNFTFEQQRVEINEIGVDSGDFSGKIIAQSVANNLVAQTITDCLIELDTELGPIATITGEIPANDKDNVVEAINYITTTIIKGLSNLTTADKTSIVNALNELDQDVGNLAGLSANIADHTSLVAALNETKDIIIGVLSNLSTTSKSSIVAAINEIKDITIGNLTNLTTQNKANLVNAINELQAEVNTLAAQVGVSVEAGLDATALAIALG
tara:strand:- start:17554 stop:18207 length:654 start_codon:yes stop_codon:yes gene_type:complete